jgi:hypothetical protein
MVLKPRLIYHQPTHVPRDCGRLPCINTISFFIFCLQRAQTFLDSQAVCLKTHKTVLTFSLIFLLFSHFLQISATFGRHPVPGLYTWLRF